MHIVTRIRQIQRGLHAGDTRSNDHHGTNFGFIF